MKSKECDQSEESEERNQSMEHAIIPNAGAGMDRLEMSFYEKNLCKWTTLPIINDEIEI